VKLRPATTADHAAIGAITTAAFGGPAGGEAAIIEGVRAEGRVLAELVAEQGGEIIGHVLFSRMTADSPKAVAALGPVSAAPLAQGQGVGSALIRAGLEACRAQGMDAVVVLGHPTYYPRFGFSAQAARQLISPYAGRAAFMAMALTAGALDAPLKVDYPAAFG
jgi:putative acetyltransferase